MKKEPAKYEYMLHTWGGFWNAHNIKVHGEPDVPYKWFDTKEERDNERQRLNKLAEKHGTIDSCIAQSVQEGYFTRYRHIIQTIGKSGDQLITIEKDLGYGFFSDADLKEEDSGTEYFKEWKWSNGEEPDDFVKLFSTVILRK